uniref:Uncharacterized protein n=1 Tax=Cacopsylla melanoneura TaxID=428564 RepID=A0A8D9EA06_9HEMI
MNLHISNQFKTVNRFLLVYLSRITNAADPFRRPFKRTKNAFKKCPKRVLLAAAATQQKEHKFVESCPRFTDAFNLSVKPVAYPISKLRENPKKLDNPRPPLSTAVDPPHPSLDSHTTNISHKKAPHEEKTKYPFFRSFFPPLLQQQNIPFPIFFPFSSNNKISLFFAMLLNIGIMRA